MRRAGFTTDGFVEAFVATLVLAGYRHFRLNEPNTREAVFRVFGFLETEVERRPLDAAWARPLANVRNLFRPGPTGAFDDLRALLRDKGYLIADFALGLPAPSARSVVASLDPEVGNLASLALARYVADPDTFRAPC